MVNTTKINHVQYQKKVDTIEKEKTVEKINCGTIECTCKKQSMWEIIVKFIKNIFKR